jgi:vitamin B12 transporter
MGSHGVVVGVDYSKGTIDANSIEGPDPEREQWAAYANDTIALGGLTITPGVRYDDISTTGGFWSPSLGATYLLFKDTLLRATVARGFNIPNLSSTSADSEINKYRANPDLMVEKMWSYQLGFESGVLDVVWLKVSAYRHDVADAIQEKQLENDWRTNVNASRQRRQGVDVELRTKPVYDVTLAGSVCFQEVEDLDTAEDVPDLPTAIYDVSLKYDDQKSFRALLKGRYLRWDLIESHNGDMSGFLVDLDLAKKFAVGAGISLEAFVSVHNLLNEAQYPSATYPNPDRWFEGGVRVSF